MGPRTLPATARPHPGRTLRRAYRVRYMLKVGDAPEMRRGRVGGAHGGQKFSLAQPSVPLDYVCHHECGCVLKSGGFGRGIRVPTFLGPEIDKGGVDLAQAIHRENTGEKPRGEKRKRSTSTAV